MTKKRMDNKSTDFGLWFRGQLPDQVTSVNCISSQKDNMVMLIPSRTSPGFDNQNLDYIWFSYNEGKVMLIEEKCRGASQDWKQEQTHSIVHEAVQFACDNGYMFSKGKCVRPGNGKEPIFRPSILEFYGYHIITFENTHPDNGWTKIDGVEVTVEQLLKFLRFEWKVGDQ